MIIEDMAEILDELCSRVGVRRVAHEFGKTKKWVHSIRNGCNFVIDANVEAGLKEFGYEIKIKKIERRETDGNGDTT